MLVMILGWLAASVVRRWWKYASAEGGESRGLVPLGELAQEAMILGECVVLGENTYSQ